MNAERDAKPRSGTRFVAITLFDAGMPPILRFWNRLMVTLLFVTVADVLSSLFGITPDGFRPFLNAVRLAAMLLLVAGWAYRTRLRPEYGFRSIFRLSRTEAIFFNIAAVGSALCIGVLQVGLEGASQTMAAVSVLISLGFCLMVIATRPGRLVAGRDAADKPRSSPVPGRSAEH